MYVLIHYPLQNQTKKIISNGFDATDVRQHLNKINKDLILAMNIFI